MAAPSSVLEVVDPRDDKRRLRVSWHPERRELIVSHWRDNVCIATTPVGIKEIAGLIGLLVGAMEDAAMRPPTPADPRDQTSSHRLPRKLLTWSRRHLGGLVSTVIDQRGRRHIADDRAGRRVA